MKHVKVNFYLEDGLEVESEGLWALPVGRKLYKIDNIPMYIEDLAVGDRVSVQREGGQLWATELVENGGHGTIWVESNEDDPEAAERNLIAIAETLSAANVSSELEGEIPRLAVDVEKAGDSAWLIGELQGMEGSGLLQYDVVKRTEWLELILRELGL